MTANVPMSKRRLAAAGVILTGAALVVGLVVQSRPAPIPPTGSPSVPVATDAPTATPSSAWGVIPVLAELAATDSDATGIASDARFVLTSKSADPAALLAERMTVSPTIELAVDAASDGRTATLTPRAPLLPATAYRFVLPGADGGVAGSWAFHVRGPVDVVRTIPGDATTAVPLSTGIEILFDQDDVADMRSHFAIAPAVEGRFERRGRAQVFIPDALEAETLYTVTIRAGLPRTGTDLTLARDVVIRFETDGKQSADTRLVFGREVLETRPADRPVVAVEAIRPEADDGSELPMPTSVDVTVYRLPSLDAAATELASFLAAPRWTQYTDPLVPTDGLRVTARFTGRLEPVAGDQALIRFPDTLDAGWYVVELAGERTSHAFLQVTPVSAWVAAASDRTVVWVNDVAHERVLAGATVAVDGGATLGRSGNDGLLIAPTPDALVPAAALGDAAEATRSWPIMRVTSPDGDAVLVPFDVAGYGDAYRGEWWEKSPPADDTYWALLYTDRGVYRQDDRIEVSGYLRGRDDGRVPSAVAIRLVHPDDARADGPAIMAVDVTPTAAGTFTASLPFVGTPLGEYVVQAVVDSRVVVNTWVDVTVIRKPSYALTLEPDHTAVISGSRVTWTLSARFFEGSTVPGLGVQATGDLFDDARTATTDSAGQATFSAVAVADADEQDATSRTLDVSPLGHETAEIQASSSVVVFQSAYQLDASGRVVDGRLAATGSLRRVDLAKAERLIASGEWAGDAGGAPVVGERVTAVVTELIPVRRQVGTEYDWIDKVVRPRYEYEIRRTRVTDLTLTTGSDGSFTIDLAIPDEDHEYEVELTADDAAHRLQRRMIYAGPPFQEVDDPGVAFVRGNGSLAGSGERYGVGDEIRWRMTSSGRRFPTGGPDRYLYLVTQRGLRSAVVTDSPVFEHRFTAADAPGIFVIGVRSTGTTYAPKAAAWADFDQRERALTVAITTDQPKYRPGDTATLTIRTTDPGGRPIAAGVVLQGVDEKLYTIGGASVPRPLDELYQRVDSGILRLTATHQLPGRPGSEGEGGDTGGGDARSDFRDTLVFRSLTTDASGIATTRVELSDDLTSWHLTAVALTADLQAGAGEVQMPVGLPFFVEATAADTYLVSDRPVVELRVFGDDVRAGAPVTFSIESKTLAIPPTTVTGNAFEAVAFALPSLALGRHELVVGATSPGTTATAAALTDRLVVPFEVLSSRLTDVRAVYGIVGEGVPTIPGSTGMTTYTFSDAGRGRVVPLLVTLADAGGARLDRLAAAAAARSLLVREFGRDPEGLPPLTFDLSQYPLSRPDDDDPVRLPGVPLLPWSSPDPWLAVRVAQLAPDQLPRGELTNVLRAILADSRTQRDLAYGALAGLATLGEPVLADLQVAAARTDLTVTERLTLAIGLAAAGDHPAAVALERGLLEDHGERLDAWVRLRLPDDSDATVEATALLAVAAAAIGDPLAPQMAAYVVANPATDTVPDLELLAYARMLLERSPAASASFAWSIDGFRKLVTLAPGDSTTVTLTPQERSTLRLETVSGQVSVVVEGRAPVDAAALEPHPDLALRRVSPTGAVAGAGFVAVELSVSFDRLAPLGCYDVVELVPSGLAPIAGSYGETDEEGLTWPVSVVGQEVRFCAVNDPAGDRPVRLAYRARVVNDGTFLWEPTVMQYPTVPSMVALTPPVSVRVGGEG